MSSDKDFQDLKESQLIGFPFRDWNLYLMEPINPPYGHRNWLDSLLGIETGCADYHVLPPVDRNWLDSLLGIETNILITDGSAAP